jgi:hypothetical protein
MPKNLSPWTASKVSIRQKKNDKGLKGNQFFGMSHGLIDLPCPWTFNKVFHGCHACNIFSMITECLFYPGKKTLIPIHNILISVNCIQ